MDLTATDLLVVQATLAAGAGPAAALHEVTNPVMAPVVAALRGGVGLPALAAGLHEHPGVGSRAGRRAPAPSGIMRLPTAAAALVRALALAEVVGAPAGPAVDGVLDAVRADLRLHGVIRIRSAQAVTSARFLVGLPVLGGVVLAALDPAARAFLGSPLGLAVMAGAGLLIGLAALWIRRLLGGIAGAGSEADPLVASDGGAWARLLRVAVAAGVGIAVVATPALGALAALLVVLGRPLVHRRSDPEEAEEVVVAAPGALPTVEALELVALGLAAGVGLGAACHLVARLGPVPTRPVLAGVATRLDAGTPPAEAFPTRLAELAHLVDITGRWGAPIADSLRLLAGDLRDRAATAAEEAAEQLTVRLVFPTTFLLVPAFGLLVVAPLVASSLSGIRLGP